MTEWWELAIPAFATLAGVAAGAGFQLLLRRGQFRQDRRMRLLDEKLRVYGRLFSLLQALPGSVDRMREDSARQDELERLVRENRDELDRVSEEISRTTSDLDSSEPHDRKKLVERIEYLKEKIEYLKNLGNRSNEISRKYSDISNELSEIGQEANARREHLRELQHLMHEVMLWGGPEVNQAATNVLSVLYDTGSTEVNEYLDQLVAKMRNDLTI